MLLFPQLGIPNTRSFPRIGSVEWGCKIQKTKLCVRADLGLLIRLGSGVAVASWLNQSQKWTLWCHALPAGNTWFCRHILSLFVIHEQINEQRVTDCENKNLIKVTGCKATCSNGPWVLSTWNDLSSMTFVKRNTQQRMHPHFLYQWHLVYALNLLRKRNPLLKILWRCLSRFRWHIQAEVNHQTLLQEYFPQLWHWSWIKHIESMQWQKNYRQLKVRT